MSMQTLSLSDSVSAHVSKLFHTLLVNTKCNLLMWTLENKDSCYPKVSLYFVGYVKLIVPLFVCFYSLKILLLPSAILFSLVQLGLPTCSYPFHTSPFNCICDRVCENQSYLHVKFDLILRLPNLITLFPNIVLYQKFHHMHTIS